MTVLKIWWKAVTQRVPILDLGPPSTPVPIILLFGISLAGCSVNPTERPRPVSDSEHVSPLKDNLLGSPGVEQPSLQTNTGLTVLPGVAEVLASLPYGRVDPFAPFLQGSSRQDPPHSPIAVLGTSPDSDLEPSPEIDWDVMGVLSVGDEHRALIRTSAGSGVVCVGGAGGRCPGASDSLLPMEVSVQAIDLRLGCLTVLHSGRSERRCMT